MRYHWIQMTTKAVLRPLKGLKRLKETHFGDEIPPKIRLLTQKDAFRREEGAETRNAECEIARREVTARQSLALPTENRTTGRFPPVWQRGKSFPVVLVEGSVGGGLWGKKLVDFGRFHGNL